nr:MAG TPA: hypothetical protein [Caudoviricetes sp.]
MWKLNHNTGLAKRNRRLTARTDRQKKPAEVRRV